tara:strand:- start:28434 stop:29735 length:1302 start_codon:yes stop_codon:yes gene_type:complete
MSATLIHHGHIRLLKKAAEHGTVVVALTSDEEVYKKKRYKPELKFDYRKEILESIKYVSEVIECPWMINEEFLKKHKIDYLFHGDDNINNVSKDHLIIVSRTEGISSYELREKSLQTLIDKRNQSKLFLTPGPAAILKEHLNELNPVFGRGDSQYNKIYDEVTSWIKSITKMDNLITFQGSATNALELAAKTFINGKVLIVDTGVYSDRFEFFLNQKNVFINHCNYDDLENFKSKVDWVMATYVETSKAFKSDIRRLRETADRLEAKLFLDSTSSIGLEEGHENADLIGFSSCEGLLGFAGAAFIAHKSSLKIIKSNNFHNTFTMNYENMKYKTTTGPYHAICSLYGVMSNYNKFVKRIKKSKKKVLEKFETFYKSDNQPILCTRLNKKIQSTNKNVEVIFYKPRLKIDGSIVCHLGEIYRDEQNIANLIEEC